MTETRLVLVETVMGECDCGLHELKREGFSHGSDCCKYRVTGYRFQRYRACPGGCVALHETRDVSCLPDGSDCTTCKDSPLPGFVPVERLCDYCEIKGRDPDCHACQAFGGIETLTLSKQRYGEIGSIFMHEGAYKLFPAMPRHWPPCAWDARADITGDEAVMALAIAETEAEKP